MTGRAVIVGSHVVFDAEFGATDATEDRFLVKLLFRPYLVRMVCLFCMTREARIVFATALKLNRDDVQVRVPVHAARLFIYGFPEDRYPFDVHDLEWPGGWLCKCL